MKLNGINWLFKKKKIKTNKKCLDCSHKRAVANNSKQSLRRYHRNKNEL